MIKNFLARLLNKMSKGMLISSSVSYGSAGIEDMPDSMKKLR